MSPDDPDRRLRVRPLTREAFAPWGDVLEATGAPDRRINAGRCARYHDRARLDFARRGGISVFRSQLVTLPYEVALLERHPRGSQAFLPMSPSRFLVIVADAQGEAPAAPRAFLAGPGQGVNLRRDVWHGVLAPLDGEGLFAVIDECGDGDNLVEWRPPQPWRVERAESA